MLFLLHDKHIAQHHAGFVGIGMLRGCSEKESVKWRVGFEQIDSKH